MVGRRNNTAPSFGQFTPGPGAYTLERLKNEAPAYRLGTEQRSTRSREKVPGPGAYDPTDRLSKGGAPGWR